MRRKFRYGIIVIILSAVALLCTACGKTPVLPSKMYGDWELATGNEQSYSDFARENKLSANKVKWTLDEKNLSAFYPVSNSAVFPVSYNKYGFEILNPDYSLFVTVYYDRESDTLYYDMNSGGKAINTH